jgi:hypothetical protein
MKRSLFLIIFHCTKAKTPFDELNLILRSWKKDIWRIMIMTIFRLIC